MGSHTMPQLTTVGVLLDSFDPGSLTETVQRSTLEHTQLKEGHFRGRLLHTACVTCRLDYGHYNRPVLATGPLAPDRITIGFILKSPAPCSLNGDAVQGGDLVIYTEGHELHARLAGGCQWVSFQLERDVLEATGLQVPQSLHAMRMLHKDTVSRLSDTLRSALRRFATPVNDSRQHAAPVFAISAVKDAMMAALCASGMARGSLMPRRSTGCRFSNPMPLVKRAEDYIDAYLDQPITIAELCAQVGCAIHTLERVFQRIHGVTPKQFLTYRRLSALRKLLLRAASEHTSVTSAALSCGLTHLGRAAVSYRRVFEETPSDTLNAARHRKIVSLDN